MPAEPVAEGEGEAEAADEAPAGESGEEGAGGEGEGEAVGPPPGDPPIAVARTPAGASLGDAVALDGTQSVGRGLAYIWTVTGPDDAAVEVTPGEVGRATFVASGRGAFRVSLLVADDVHRTDIGQEQEVEIAGFAVLDRSVDARDIATFPFFFAQHSLINLWTESGSPCIETDCPCHWCQRLCGACVVC